MQRYSETINLPVLCADNGRRAGTVKDVIFSLELKKVKALLLEHSGISFKRKVVFLEDLLNLGNDAAIINDGGHISELDRETYSKDFNDEGVLLGLKVFSKAGIELGTVKDVIFDRRTGRIEELEVSDGMFRDVIQGRKMVPLFGKVEFSKEYAIVGEEAVEEMEETGGGIKNRLFK